MFRKGLILSALALLGLVGCSTMGDPRENEKGRKRVVVTIPALASFVHASLAVTTSPYALSALPLARTVSRLIVEMRPSYAVRTSY
jgi:hypothetical protein